MHSRTNTYYLQSTFIHTYILFVGTLPWRNKELTNSNTHWHGCGWGPNVDRFQHLYRSSSISRKGVSNVIVVVIFKMATTTRTAAGSTYHFLESFKALMGIEGWIVGTTPLILGLKSFKLGQPWRRPPPYIQPLNHPRASILWPNSCKCLIWIVNTRKVIMSNDDFF